MSPPEAVPALNALYFNAHPALYWGHSSYTDRPPPTMSCFSVLTRSDRAAISKVGWGELASPNINESIPAWKPGRMEMF